MKFLAVLRKNHIDPDLFDILLSQNHMKLMQSTFGSELVDEVDSDALLAIQPDSIG